jgi:hypothetical protein
MMVEKETARDYTRICCRKRAVVNPSRKVSGIDKVDKRQQREIILTLVVEREEEGCCSRGVLWMLWLTVRS